MTRYASTVLLVAIAAAVLALLLSMIPTIGIAGADPAPDEIWKCAELGCDQQQELVDPGCVDTGGQCWCEPRMQSVEPRRCEWVEPPKAVGIASIPPLGAQAPPPDLSAAPDLDLWRTGLPLALILGALYAGLTVLGRQDPKRSLLWTFAAAVVLLVADAFRVDVTPNARMILAAVGAIGTAAAPGMQPSHPSHPRDPERGRIASRLLIALACLALVLAFALFAGCTKAQRTSLRDAASDILVDCTAIAARDAIDQYGGLLEETFRAALRSDGTVDTASLGRAVRGLALTTGWCAAGAAFQRVLAELPAARVAPGGYNPAGNLYEAWEEIRLHFAGRRFDLGGGTVM